MSTPTTIGIDIGGSSVKAALLASGGAIRSAKSDRYWSPDAQTIVAAIRDTLQQLGGLALEAARAGLCAPGVRGPDGWTVVKCVNLPGLDGVRLDSLVQDAAGRPVEVTAVTSDVHAAAVDIHALSPRPGRLLVLAIGTGVGACILDDGAHLKLTGNSSGHIGQIDVSLGSENAEVPTGPDGGRGSLEAYIGLPALERRYGRHLEHVVATMDETSPPLLALARAIRICHAIYRPDRVVLAGGVGILLAQRLRLLRGLVERDLTRLARPGWELEAASGLFHAAAGAARLAASD